MSCYLGKSREHLWMVELLERWRENTLVVEKKRRLLVVTRELWWGSCRKAVEAAIELPKMQGQ